MGSGEQDKRIMWLETELAKLRNQLARREHEISRLNELVDIDPLLPILNRRAFLREADRAWASATRHDHGLALIFLDIDKLKSINDRHGHAAGDTVLRSVSDILSANTRKGDLLGRMGGDEFALLLTHIELEQAEAKAQLLSTAVQSEPVSTEDADIAVTVTCGVCGMQGHSDITSLLHVADARMLLAKRSKR